MGRKILEIWVEIMMRLVQEPQLSTRDVEELTKEYTHTVRQLLLYLKSTFPYPLDQYWTINQMIMMAVLYCWMKVLFQKKHLMGWNVSCHQSRRNLKETTIMLHKSKCHCNERQSPSTTIHAYLTMYCASRYASWVGAPSHDNSVHGKYPFFVVSSSS